jgi:hypothetical protein
MSRASLTAATATLLFASLCASRAEALTLIHLKAKQIAFYYDRFVIDATGGVQVVTSDGLRVSGDVFTMDLRLDRFLVAGNVTVRTKNATLSGAALSDFLNFDRVYFIPVTAEPDRWTFLNGDFAHPVPGRIMPGDAFEFASNGGESPSYVATAAVIGTNSYLRLSGVRADVAGVLVPIPPFYVSFAPTPALARNSLSGANADLTYQFAGNANSISALHLRYDATNHLYASFEQHLAGDREYAVFSVNPATSPAKFWNLLTSDQLGERFQIDTFTQLYTYQYGLGDPDASAQYTYVTATEGLPRWSLQAVADFTNYNLLGPGSFQHDVLPNGQTVGELNHPSQLQLTATSFQERIFGSPFYEQYFFGAGFAHDSVGNGLQSYGGTTYTTVYDKLAGFTVSMPELEFGNLGCLHPSCQYDKYVLAASFTKEREWFSVPHYVDTTNFTGTISRQVVRTLGIYAGYSILNTGDRYTHGSYSVSSPIVNGVYDPGFLAFKGLATQRTFSFGENYVPSPEFSLNLLYRHHDDFPAPVPGVFPLPPLNPLGQYIYQNYLGQPPNDLTGDLHVQVAKHIAFDVARTYYFGYATLKWSPSTVVVLEWPQ